MALIHKHNQQLTNILALFSLSNPEIIKHLKTKVTESELVAAHLTSNLQTDNASVCIISIDDIQYEFNLDLKSRICQSKGNWIWVKQIDIYFQQTNILSIAINPRIIDLPYTKNCLCAHWLFKNVIYELTPLIDNYL